MSTEYFVEKSYITIPDEYKSHIRNVGQKEFSKISSIPIPTISLFLRKRKGRVTERTWKKILSAMPCDVRTSSIEPPAPVPSAPVPSAVDMPERTRLPGPTIKVRVVVDGHEGEHPAWTISVVTEFARCLRSCRATGKRPTVRNVTDRFKRPSRAEVQEDAAYRPFWLAYNQYIVDDVSHRDRSIMVFVHKQG